MFVFPGIGIKGRLGNQMFQLAALKAVSLKNKGKAFLPEDLDNRVHHGQKCLLNYFKHEVSFINSSECAHLPIFYESDNHLQVINSHFFDIKDSCAIDGHFESELFFRDYKEEVKKMFIFIDEIQLYAENYINSLKESNPGSEIVGIHLRRGDYHEPHQYPLLFIKFVNFARDFYFNNPKYIFLVFTGGNIQEDNSNYTDLAWCKENINNSHYCETNSTIKDLAIMTQCDHMILTTKSTLGWWGAYLNKNPNKKIVVPAVSIGPQFNPAIYWPDYFIKL
jgi:hypothetical protein